ncbi:MAG TPA: DPP IV N-terminal domain-containing protein, partial [Tepidisphaeraceae bacterium]|nr:DPP IV N-terminal domain-containing protein [Tepidisphaeraceae bacterium]
WPAAGQKWMSVRCLALLSALWIAQWTFAAGPGVYRNKVEPHWFAQGSRFWYRVETGPGAHQFVLVDAAHGSRGPAFDHRRLAGAWSKLAGRELSADRLPITDLNFEAEAGAVLITSRDRVYRLELATYTFAEHQQPVALVPSNQPGPSSNSGSETFVDFRNQSRRPVKLFWLDSVGKQRLYATLQPGAERHQHTYAGHKWLVTDPAGRRLAVFEAASSRGIATIETKATTAPATAPASIRNVGRPRARHGPESPDKKWVVFVRDANLFLREQSTHTEFPLGNDGTPADGYAADRVWWSPDSRHLVATRVERGEEHKIYTVESSPADQVQPKLRTLDYPKPGDRIDHPRPRLFDIKTRQPVPVTDELFGNPWSIEDIRWDADGSRFTFVYNQRGHQALRVIAVDAQTGEARAIVDEESKTFIDYSGKSFRHWIGDNELIWMSERDGWNHLWLYDAAAGIVKNKITDGPWVVRSVTHVDERGRQIWFMAGGVRPGQDPYYTHFCRVNFDGSGFTILTEGDGNHTVQWAPGEAYFLDTWSRVDRPPVIELRRSDTGALVCNLEEADASAALKLRGGPWPERFVAKGRDGATDIYGIILFPRDFDGARTYPVVEQIYAGPQDFYTPKSFRADPGKLQRIADQGMIAVQCDGMGTSGRSKAFHDVCWKNLKDAGLPDHIAWIKAAAAAHPQMDLSRVGIFGGSAGGQNALAALLWHHDFYTVAVADCGCHDNRMDKIWWNEQWMGWPVDKSYEESSNVVNAHLLEGKLMLIVGEMDDNVDPSSTFQVVNALEKADKDFELVVVTGAHHGAAETPYGSRRRLEFLTGNLLHPQAAKAR